MVGNSKFMKIKVKHKRNYGVDMFYPADDWTTEFFSVLKSPSIKAKCLYRNKIEKLKELGFEIEISKEEYIL